MIGRGERFCEVVVCLSRDEDEDEDGDEDGKFGKFGKRGWWEDQGGKKGERGRGKVVGGWWLVIYLTCTSLPLIPCEMRYMGMIMSMNMNTYENFSLASSTVQVQSDWLFLLLYDR